MAKLKLKNTFDCSTHEVELIRPFNLTDGAVLALTGSDFDDHELWLLHGSGLANLVGTLPEHEYKHLRRSKHLSLEFGKFAWVKPEFLKENGGRTFSGKQGPLGLLFSSILFEYFEDCSPATA